MGKNSLLKTNIILCVVIALGFIVTSIISLNSNKAILKQNVEQISQVTSDGICFEINSAFTKPVTVATTMAGSSLLHAFLSREGQHINDPAFVQEMKEYLLSYKKEYGYGYVFLVSSETKRYYHSAGIGRTIIPDDPEDRWYYECLEADTEYLLNIDDGPTADDTTVFVNCKIKNPNGTVRGITGVGFKINHLQQILKEYEDKFGLQVYLIDKTGTIKISAGDIVDHTSNLFAAGTYPQLRDRILSGKGDAPFWYSSKEGTGYIVTQYMPNLGWYLIVDNDISFLRDKIGSRFFGEIAVIAAVAVIVLIMSTNIIRKYDTQLAIHTVENEEKHRSIFRTATEKMYESIHEFDITHNRAVSKSTLHFLENLGIPQNISYDEALNLIAQKQIKEEYRKGYIETFSVSNIMKVFKAGTESLHYDFMIRENGRNYYWMRITARIFYWDDDQSVHMFTYRQNIDAEKRYEKKMLEQIQKDALSGLYNKTTTQEKIRKVLRTARNSFHAFIILDIDDFKQIYDTMGHSFGDIVIQEFSVILRENFRSDDIVGRIGGDEFAAFISIPDTQWIRKKAEKINETLSTTIEHGGKSCRISASIGIAIAPEAGTDFDTLYRHADTALYLTKKRGKNDFSVYSGTPPTSANGNGTSGFNA